MRTFYPPQLSKFPHFGQPERGNRAALIHEQGHSGQNMRTRALHLRTNWLDQTTGKRTLFDVFTPIVANDVFVNSHHLPSYISLK